MNTLLQSRFVQLLIIMSIAAGLLVPATLSGQLQLAGTAIVGLFGALLLIRHPIYPLLLYVILIPLEELIVLDALGTLTRVAAIAFTGSYLFHRKFQLDFRAMRLAGWLWLLWAFASLLWSLQADTSSFFQLLQLVFMAFLIADYLARHSSQVMTILGAYTLSAIIVASIGIANFFQGIEMGLSESARTSAFEGQSVAHFAFYMLPALFTTLHVVLTDRYNLRLRLLAALGFSVLLLAIIMSGTRGAWLAIVVAVVLVYLPRLNRRQLASLAIVILLSTAIMSQIPVVTDFIRYRTEDAISSGGAGRTAIWLVGLQTVIDHPVIGVGFRNFEAALTLERFERSPFNLGLYRPFTSMSAHNIYLQILAELGIIGFFLFGLWLFVLLSTPASHPEHRLVFIILIAMLVAGITNPQLNRKYFWFSIGLAEALRYAWVRAQHLRLKNKYEQRET